MAAETWEEVRYHVLGQLPVLNKKIDSLETKLGVVETKFESGMAVITTKMGMITFISSSVVSVIIGLAVHFLGGK
jgi:hypothetical protein